MHINLIRNSQILVILIGLNAFYPFFCLHFCFLIEKITKGKKTPVSLLEHIYGSTDFLDQH